MSETQIRKSLLVGLHLHLRLVGLVLLLVLVLATLRSILLGSSLLTGSLVGSKVRGVSA